MTNKPFQFDQFEQVTQDATNSSREAVEAFTQSGAIFAKGFEEFMKTAAAMTQSAVEKQTEYTKELMGSKTPEEFTQAQNKIAQSSYDEFVSDATKLSEMGTKIITEASEPLNSQVEKAMEKAGKMAA